MRNLPAAHAGPIFFASQLAVVIAFWAVWQTGRRMLGERQALVGVLLLEGVIYYNFTSPEFNANILQLPFWALIGWSFYRAVKDNRLVDWLLLGLWSAGGLYSKYSTVLLLATLGFVMLVRPEGRRRLRGPGPWLAVATAFILFLPHILWLFANNFIPFDYASNQLRPLHHSFSLLFGLVGGQLLALLPAALLYFAVFSRQQQHGEDSLHSFDRAFLCSITFGPFMLTFLAATITGFKIHDMWGTPFWNFIGLWAIFRFPPKLSRESLQRFAFGWSLIFIFCIAAYAGSVIYGPYITHKTERIHFPGRALAKTMGAAWHDRFQRPMKYVIGDIWPAGNVAYYSKERPHVLIMGDYKISPWINPADLAKEGGIIVWCVRHCARHDYEEVIPPFVHDEFPQAEIQAPFTLPRETGAEVDPVVMDWAVLAPKQ